MFTRHYKQPMCWAILLSGGLLAKGVLAENVPIIKLNDVEIPALVATIAKITHKNFIIDPQVPPTRVTFISEGGVSERELYNTFQSILQVHGLMAVESGDMIKIVPMQKARQTSVPPLVDITSSSRRKKGKATTDTMPDGTPQSATDLTEDMGTAPTIASKQGDLALDEVVSQVVTLQYIPVLTANASLMPLVGQGGDTLVVPNQSSNTLLVTGRSQNVERVLELVRSIDKPSTASNDFELINLKYAVATQTAQTLQQLMAPNPNDPAAALNPWRVSADERTNSILISGDKATRERLKASLVRLDIPRKEMGGTRVVRLKYANAEELAQTLQGISQGVQQQTAGIAEGSAAALMGKGSLVNITADKGTNSLVVTAPDYLYQNVMRVIAQLDIPKQESGGTRVIKLKYAVASEMATTLQGIVQSVQTNTARTVEGAAATAALAGAANLVNIAADQGTNSLVVTAPDYLYVNIMRVVAQLDIPKRDKGGTEVIKLKYAVAEEMATTLQGIVQGVQTNTARTVEGAAAVAGATASAGAAGGGAGALVSIVPDKNTNSLVVTSPAYLYPEIKRVIAQLDVPQKKTGGTVVIPLKYAKAEELVEVLKGVSPGLQQQTKGTTEGSALPAVTGTDAVSVLADKTTNSIVITAPDFMQANLRRVIAELDRRRAQVMIEAIIAEVSIDLANQLGVSLISAPERGSSGGVIGASNMGGGLNQAFSLASAVQSGGGAALGAGLLFGLGKVIGNMQFGMIANALKGDAATNILATPTLVTLDNEEASIVVGQEVPFITGSYTAANTGISNPFNTIQRKDVGLSLKVTPQINRGKTIKLKIDQEVSNLASTSVSTSDVVTNKRQITTNVMVEDGQMLVLGGLIQDNFRDAQEKVPVLGDLPLIGRAFRGNNTSKTKQNLMVFIHPVILPDGEASDVYTRQKYETMQAQQQDSQILSRGGKDQRATQLRDIQGVYSADELHRPVDPFSGFGCTKMFCPEVK